MPKPKLELVSSAISCHEANLTEREIYQKVFGRRGMYLALRARLSATALEVETSPPGIRHPVVLRLKTSDPSAFWQVFLEGEYALPLRKPPKTIIDAGANVGFASAYFANAYPEAKILAIEPEQSNFELLRRNLAPYPNVVPIQAALWSVNGTIDVLDPGEGHWGFRTGTAPSSSSPTGTVQARTVDDIMTEYGCESIDFLKMDIEGAEREVFADPSAWIDKVGVIVAEMHDRYKVGCSRSFYLATKGFDLEVHRGENIFMLRDEFVPESLR